MALVFLALVVPGAAMAAPALESYYYNSTPVAPPPVKKALPPQPAAPVPGGKSHVVTSVQKCFDEIGPEAAREIRRRSLTPYAECQKQLRARERAAVKEEPQAETPRNFRRVTEPQTPEEAPAKEAPAKKEDKKTGKK